MTALPELLRRAGMDWRSATQGDLPFVISSWRESALKPFLLGSGCPFLGLEHKVALARAANHRKTLECIFNREHPGLVRRALAEAAPLVVFDSDEPSFIVGWGHPRYRYVKQNFRSMGIGTLLREAVSPEALTG